MDSKVCNELTKPVAKATVRSFVAELDRPYPTKVSRVFTYLLSSVLLLGRNRRHLPSLRGSLDLRIFLRSICTTAYHDLESPLTENDIRMCTVEIWIMPGFAILGPLSGDFLKIQHGTGRMQLEDCGRFGDIWTLWSVSRLVSATLSFSLTEIESLGRNVIQVDVIIDHLTTQRLLDGMCRGLFFEWEKIYSYSSNVV
jgi:hypothetical protein